MSILVYNTLSREKEPFIPIKPPRVGMYVCGPTVYDYCHVGHARAYVTFDMIRKYLTYSGYNVLFVENITDVDDKIIKRALELKEEPINLSKKFSELFFEDMDKLSVQRANIYPKVTEHMPEIIESIQKIIDKGYAYVVNGDVYFSLDKVDVVGPLTHQSRAQLMAGARVEIDERKRNPMDFALWKSSKPGEISWPSPWGDGRPGWHIECSTMSMHYLSSSLDIHGGGQDLIFPHHECELLQSESITGEKFVKYWIHNGLITIDKEKMSKSLGNFFTIREVLNKFEPSVLRFFILYSHYRSPLDFSDVHLLESKEGLSRLKNILHNLTVRRDEAKESEIKDNDKSLIKLSEDLKMKFISCMNDDFNTRTAISELFTFTSALNEIIAEEVELSINTYKILINTYYDVDRVLGILVKDIKSMDILRDLMNIIIYIRNDLREKKDFVLSDKIRVKLKDSHIIIEDEGRETKWRME